MPWESDPVFLVLVLILGAIKVYDVETGSDDRSEAERARDAYAAGEITLDELERRLDVAECQEAEKIRNAAQTVSGVGPDLSYAIASHFDTYAAFRDADRDEFESIHGVGESLSDELVRRLQEGR